MNNSNLVAVQNFVKLLFASFFSTFVVFGAQKTALC